jgi:hypothetical protein
MLDQIRRDIQARLEDLLGEIDKLRRALTALTSRESEPDRSGRATPRASSASAGESAAKSSRAATPRAPRTRKASVPPRPTAPAPASSAGAGAGADRAGRDQGRRPGSAQGRQRDDGRRDRRPLPDWAARRSAPPSQGSRRPARSPRPLVATRSDRATRPCSTALGRPALRRSRRSCRAPSLAKQGASESKGSRRAGACERPGQGPGVLVWCGGSHRQTRAELSDPARVSDGD